MREVVTDVAIEVSTLGIGRQQLLKAVQGNVVEPIDGAISKFQFE
jgi:hypothetical protein